VAVWKFPTPYALWAKVKIRYDKLPQFRTAAARIATAFFQHKTSSPWAAYSTVAGPGLYAYVLVPLSDIAQLDQMEALDTVMSDVYGIDGMNDLTLFRETIEEMDISVVSAIDSGTPSCEIGPRPPEYLFYASAPLHPSKVGQFVASTKRAAEAQGESSRWFAYGTFAGRRRIHGFVAGSAIAELAGVSTGEGVVERRYGAEAGGPILSDLQESIVDVESAILRYMSHHNG
jgi:hypothetical protein